MLADEEYWSWPQIVQLASKLAIKAIAPSVLSVKETPSTSHELFTAQQAICTALVSTGKADNLAEAVFAMEIAQLWTLANIMDAYDAVLCSPNGDARRCPPILKHHADALHRWRWPLDLDRLTEGESEGFYVGFRRGLFNISDACDRFAALDYGTGRITLKPNTIDLLKRASVGTYFEDQELSETVDELIRPTVGWSIAWAKDSVPANEYKIFQDLGLTELLKAEQKNSGEHGKDGRKSKFIVECLYQAFPDGKGKTTWKDVDARIGYSRRTIVRSLEAEGRKEDWLKGGQLRK